VAALADTNVLVYRFDQRDRAKQKTAAELLKRGLADGSMMLAHQAIVEFVAACTRPLKDGTSILAPADASREAEELMRQFPVLYPDDAVLRAAFRGAATYQLAWFDAHMWAYADVHHLDTIYSEDFQHGRFYGTVRIVDPFRETE
jgi:predicted nucleic acid-binding protein